MRGEAGSQALPSDFRWPFAMLTQESTVFLLWAQSRKESLLWRRELNGCIKTNEVRRDKISLESFLSKAISDEGHNFVIHWFKVLFSNRFDCKIS